MAIFCNDGRLGIADLATVDTAARVPLGTIITGYDSVTEREGEYIYTKFNATTTVGQLCKIDSTNESTLFDNDTDANLGCPVGWAVGASYAADEFGWLQIAGKVKAKAGTVAANGKVYGTATGGTVDDAAVAGCQIYGAKFVTTDGTPAAGFAYVECNRPHSMATTA
mgnify:CR=1 FL=1